MSNTLRDTAESTVHTLSGLVHDVRDRLEDLPPARRTKRRPLLWAFVLIVAAAVAAGAARSIVRHRSTAQPTTDRARSSARGSDNTPDEEIVSLRSA